MNIQKGNIDNDIFTKKVILLNKLYYIITHQIWTFRNMNDLDNLINRFTDLSDSLKKPKDEEMLLRNIRKKGNIDTHRYSNKAK
jgi:hypothetical protein